MRTKLFAAVAEYLSFSKIEKNLMFIAQIAKLNQSMSLLTARMNVLFGMGITTVTTTGQCSKVS